MSSKSQTDTVRTQVEQSTQKEHSAPIYLTSSFTFDSTEEMRAAFADEIDANIYSRFTNPNVKEFVDKLCQMEGAEAGVGTASGMAAIFSTFAALLQNGDHILSCRSVFGSTHGVFNKILPKWGITHTYVDANNKDSWESAITDRTKLIYAETPTNPGVDIIDLEWLGQLAKKRNVILVIDNCFATPVLQRPIEYGADLSIHSATKFMDGQGRVLGGAVVGRKDLIDEIFAFCRSTGPSLSPFNAWVLSKSLETLELRMEKHSANALELAQFLEDKEEIEQVRYPFLESHPQHRVAKSQMQAGGGIVAFEIEGGIEAGRQFLDSLVLCSLTANLGDTRTIATHPASTTHAKLTEEERLETGITPGLVRISVGLEHVEDIIGDIGQALQATK